MGVHIIIYIIDGITLLKGVAPFGVRGKVYSVCAVRVNSVVGGCSLLFSIAADTQYLQNFKGILFAYTRLNGDIPNKISCSQSGDGAGCVGYHWCRIGIQGDHSSAVVNNAYIILIIACQAINFNSWFVT